MFDQLIDEQLSAVTFVQDYLQLHFDGPTINVTAPITIHDAGRSVSSTEPGFRDAVCNQIAKFVGRITVVPHEQLVIEFRDGARIEILVGLASTEAYYAHGFAAGEWTSE